MLGLDVFRGLAEGITGGVDNFTRFPARFLFLGQGYLWGVLPPQLPEVMDALAQLPGLELEGLSTHFAEADSGAASSRIANAAAAPAPT